MIPCVEDHRATRNWTHAVALCLALIPAIALSSAATPVHAQASGMAGLGDTDTVTLKATVKAVDTKARTVTLVGPNGETKTIKVGPEVQNLAEVKAGDTVVARYVDSVAYVVAPAGTKSPDDMLAVAEAQSAPGALPAAAMAGKAVITGVVVGINPAARTISIVKPDGGEVRTFTIKNPDYQGLLSSAKVGDSITAVLSEAIVIAVETTK